MNRISFSITAAMDFLIGDGKNISPTILLVATEQELNIITLDCLLRGT